MRFGILGPLQVSVGSDEVVIARRERVLLAVLLLHANRAVSVERVVDAIWGERPPADSTGQVHSSVYRLRKALAAVGASREVIVTDPAGYRVRVDPQSLDLAQFRELRHRARAAAGSGQPDEARGLYRSALDLWRGRALDGVDSDLVRHAVAGLDEEHLQMAEECIEVELSLGRGREVVAELTELVGRFPHREGLHRAWMLALYRAGRQADALAAYRRARTLLNEELGLEPGPELQRLHQAILNRDPELDPPADPVPGASPPGSGRSAVPRELPADVAGFTGRGDALKTLDGLLAGAQEESPGPVVISAIAGTAGIGKTALAVHWGHQVADRFPDGQLYLNLRGYATGPPVRPIGALAALLRALGTPAEQIPADREQAAGLYRSQLAGKRVLVVLDNAASADQVRPLLPGTSGCLVLVTSRNRLQGLVARDGAQRLTLDVLTADEAIALLTHLLGAERVGSEPDATRGLAAACAYLPLAVRVVAANLLDQPHRGIAGYVTELTTGDRLSQLQADSDEETAVRVTFDLSYQRLPNEAQRLFRMLGLVPGPDCTEEAAAALAGVPVAEAKPLLTELASAHLVDEHAPGRFTFHDLLRAYARDRVEREETPTSRTEAVQRLLRWYARGAITAADILYPEVLRLPSPPELERGPAPAFGGPPEALAWLEDEHANLITAIRYATGTTGLCPFAWQLISCLYGYFWQRRHAVEWEEVTQAALFTAEREQAPAAQAAMRWSLAGAHRARGRYPDAAAELTAAADLAHGLKWDEGEGYALANLGMVQVVVGEFEQANGCLLRARSLAQQTGRRALEALILGNLGYLSKQAGRLREAASFCADQLSLNRQLRLADTHNLARSLNNLGNVESTLGFLDAADQKISEALLLHREAGRRWGEVNALLSLAMVRADSGGLASADELAHMALSVGQRIGDPRKICEAHDAMGAVHLRSGQLHQAIRCSQRALSLARQNGDPNSQFLALHGLASARCYLDHYATAAGHATGAWNLARRIGYLVFEGLAMTILADIRCGQGRHDEAYDLAHRALASHRQTGYRFGEARTQAVLGTLLKAAGSPEAAELHRRAARELFAEMGAPIPHELAARL